jgi:hypothetical protein
VSGYAGQAQGAIEKVAGVRLEGLIAAQLPGGADRGCNQRCQRWRGVDCGGPYLAQDFSLAEDHRVEASCDFSQVIERGPADKRYVGVTVAGPGVVNLDALAAREMDSVRGVLTSAELQRVPLSAALRGKGGPTAQL